MKMIIFLLILSGGIIQHHCTDTDINHAVQITGYDFNGKTWVLSLSKTYFPLTEWMTWVHSVHQLALICSVLVTNSAILSIYATFVLMATQLIHALIPLLFKVKENGFYVK